MNRQVLLRTLAEKGYKGKPALEDVRSYLESQGFDTKSVSVGENKTETLDTIWSKTVHLMCDAGEQVQQHEPPGATSEPAPEQAQAQKSAPEPEVKNTTRQNYRPGIGWRDGPGKVEGKSVEPRGKRDFAKKQYELKAARGETLLPDPDTAEVAGAWLRMVHSDIRGFSYSEKKHDVQICEKANTELVATDGGVLVPEEFHPTVLWSTEEYGVARRLANVIPMKRDYDTYPRKTGIVSMAALSEGGTITDTSNTYDRVGLTAKKFGALIKISSELWEDSAVSMADEYVKTLTEAQMAAEDDVYFLGDGSATYNGFVGLAQGLVSGAYVSATGSGWSSFVEADFLTGGVGVLQNINPGRIKFVCSRQFYFQVMVRVANAKSGTTPQAIFGPPAGFTGAGAMFYGYPVYFSQRMPTATGSSEQRACYVGDFLGGSMLGDRKQLTIATSDQRYFDTDQYAIRGISRFSVNIHGDGRGTTYGPIVSMTST